MDVDPEPENAKIGRKTIVINYFYLNVSSVVFV